MIETTARYPKVKDEIVRFNVGGTQFATSKSNITKKIPIDSLPSSTTSETDKLENVDNYYEPNMLEGLISGITEIKLDKTGSIFIDRNSKQDKSAFLFSLVNKENRPFVLNIDPQSNQSIYTNSGYGPTFDGGHDLHI